VVKAVLARSPPAAFLEEQQLLYWDGRTKRPLLAVRQLQLAVGPV